MAAITREQVSAPVLRTETVEMPSLGGSVTVRAVMYSERQRIQAEASRAAAQAPAGATAEETSAAIGAVVVLHRLAAYVVLDDGKPMWTPEQWDVFASQNPGELLDVYEVAKRLNGHDSEHTAKNS